MSMYVLFCRYIISNVAKNRPFHSFYINYSFFDLTDIVLYHDMIWYNIFSNSTALYLGTWDNTNMHFDMLISFFEFITVSKSPVSQLTDHVFKLISQLCINTSTDIFWFNKKRKMSVIFLLQYITLIYFLQYIKPFISCQKAPMF